MNDVLWLEAISHQPRARENLIMANNTATLIGTLKFNPHGRWEISREGRQPYELSSGDMFLLEVDGVLRLTSIEFRHFTGPPKGREYRGQAGEYHSVDGYRLAHGLRAAPPNEAKDGQTL